MQKVSLTTITVAAVQTSICFLCHVQWLQSVKLSPAVQAQFSAACALHICPVVAYINTFLCLFYTLNVFKLDFSSVEPRPRLLCVTMWRPVFFFANVRRGHAEVGRTLTALSHLVRFALTALGCPSLTRRWKGPRGQTLEIVSVCRRERKQALFHSSLARAWLHLLSREFPHCAWWIQGGAVVSLAWLEEAVCLLLPKQLSSAGEERDQRHEEKGGADFPPAHRVNAWSSISLKGWLDCAGRRHLNKHKLL